MLRTVGRALLALGLLCAAAGWADVPVPPVARVTDQTGTLTPDQVAALEAKLAAFEQRKGSQIAVLIVPTTAPEAIEQYGIRVAEQWKLGRKGVDDGALLLIAKDDRALRIEVGYGLEGALSDIVSNRIIEDIVVPRFKSGDFYGGIDAGADAMIKVVDGEPLPAPQTWKAPPAENGSYKTLLLVGFFVAVILGGALRTWLGRLPGAALTSAAVGALVWLMIASVAVAVVAGIATFVFVLAGGPSAILTSGSGGYRGGGGFGRGGGFGGGGGGFGGGGASGRW